jgi:hypothetical protein
LDYHKHKTPSESGVKVFIEVWLQEITSINERTADFEAELYLSEIWVTICWFIIDFPIFRLITRSILRG